MTDSTPTLTRNQTQGFQEGVTLLKGVHTISVGAGYTRADLNTRADPNARGTFNFTGIATSLIGVSATPTTGTGYDLADFLLGYPQSSTIQYSGLSNYFRQNQANLYAQIYAPQSDFTQTGQADIYGSVIAKTLTFGGSWQGGIHLDESIPTPGISKVIQMVK